MPIGKTFIAVDSEAIGDGGDFTLLADTWVQRRIQHNAEDVLSRGNPICLSPYSSSANDFTSLAGIRPYLAHQYHTIWTGWVSVRPDQTGASFTFSYHATVPGSSSDAGSVFCEVEIGGFSAIEVLTNTYDSGETTGHYTVEVEFDDPVKQAGFVECKISVASTLTGGGVQSGLGATANGATGSTLDMSANDVNFAEDTAPGANAVFAYNSSGTAPDQASLETMLLRLSKTATVWPNSEYEPRHDLIATNGDNAAAKCYGSVVQRLPGPQGPSDKLDGLAVRGQCFLLRSFVYEAVFGSTSTPYAQSATLPEPRLAPREEFGSAEAMFTASQARKAYLQPRTQLVGPRGRKVNSTAATNTDLDPFDFYGYATHWPMVVGSYDDSVIGQLTEVVNDTFYIDTIDPSMELVCLWVSSQPNAPWNGKAGEVVSRGHGKNKRKPFEKGGVDYSEQRTRASWDITILVDQMEDFTGSADWDTEATEYASSTDRKTIPVFGGTGDEAPPIMRGIYAMANGNKSTGNPPGFWYKEGSFFTEDLESGILHETRHSLNISGMDNDACNLPFRLKVNADLNNFDFPIFTPNISDIASQLRLYLVGFALIELPKEP